ncbi:MULTISPECIES: tyrosine-type recombinase/integrase [unclassified Granulicatella]|uniref:tyrosine-type recombinase/integrase n=1 Tax=unclassified Granulicatella TaxID=2630493 RepID=UPI0010743C07|nr:MULTISPECIES: tyrosine-type recombinase/integrase [unclassified Granulicatella]MBF0780303.1 tyrosine-type recombinase/integrase [Granulicatella sp. 19428wC4_WM01]TFU95581.1 integrase [Granulicatella sp. WM01]
MDYTIISNYLDYCYRYKRLSPHSIRAYKNDLTQFYHLCGFDVETYINHLNHSTLKPKTLKRKIATLKVFFAYLETKKLINTNPFRHLTFKFRTEKLLPKVISLPYLKNIYEYLYTNKILAKTPYQKEKTHRNLLIIELLLSTGIRVSELCNLSISNINLQSRSLNIMGKGKKERMIYIGNDITYSLLKEYIQTYKQNSHHFLFQNDNQKNHISEQAVRLMIKTTCEKIKIYTPITPHMFRHTFATMLLDNNVDIRYIQHILGHSSIAITQIYTHVSQHKQQDILTLHNPINTLHH